MIAVVGATLHPMTGSGPIDNATVLIEDGRFAEIGPGLAPPPGARVIEARGAIVTPGLISAGSHLGLVEVSAIPETCDLDAPTPEAGSLVDVRYALNAHSTLLARARADGFSRAVVWPGPKVRRGLGAALCLGEGDELLDTPGLALFVSLEGAPRALAWPALRASIEKADAAAPSAEARAFAAVAAGRAPLAVRARRESDIREAAALAHDFAIKVVVLRGTEAWRAADLLASLDVAVVVDPFEETAPDWDGIGARLDNAAILQRAGVEIGFTGHSIHFSHNAGAAAREGAGLAVANGLDWAAGLRALTADAATTWGLGDRLGCIAPGREADLVVWDGDPLEPASTPAAMLIAGREAGLETRQGRLARRYHPSVMNSPWPPAYR